MRIALYALLVRVCPHQQLNLAQALESGRVDAKAVTRAGDGVWGCRLDRLRQLGDVAIHLAQQGSMGSTWQAHGTTAQHRAKRRS